MTPAKYAALVAQLEKAEAELSRAVNKWQKLRAKVKRAVRTLDADFAKRADGQADWRDFADSLDGAAEMRALTAEQRAKRDR